MTDSNDTTTSIVYPIHLVNTPSLAAVADVNFIEMRDFSLTPMSNEFIHKISHTCSEKCFEAANNNPEIMEKILLVVEKGGSATEEEILNILDSVSCIKKEQVTNNDI